jgi:cellulose 1,4-beta-cellobiosidase
MPGQSSGLPYKAYYYRVAAVNSVATEASTTGAYATIGPIYPNFRTFTGGVVDPVTPAAPTGLLFTPSSVQTSVNLSWTAPVFDGDATITNYRVRYNAVGSTSSTTVLTGSTSTSYTLTGLPKSTNFEIDVAAVNSVGTGSYSNKVDAYTLVVSTEVGLIKTYDSAAGGWRVLV